MSPVTTSSLPPIPGYDVDVTLDNLVALADELCTDSIAVCDDEVTLTRSSDSPPVRWRGVIGRRGLVRL